MLVGQQSFGQNCDLNTNLQVPLKIKVKIKTWKYDTFPCILCKKFPSNLAWICQLRSMNENFYTSFFFKKLKISLENLFKLVYPLFIWRKFYTYKISARTLVRTFRTLSCIFKWVLNPSMYLSPSKLTSI